MISHRYWRRALAVVSLVALSSLSFTIPANAARAFPVPGFSIRLEDQLLANLRYLPVAFHPVIRAQKVSTSTTSTSTTTTPTTTTSNSSTTTTSTPTTTTTAVRKRRIRKVSPTKLVRGNFEWRFSSLPHVLRSEWRVGTDNVVLRGALMRFQSVSNLPTTGSMDGTTWRDLVGAALQHRVNPSTYNVVLVSKTLPETATLYLNGRLAYKTLVNTGVTNATTADGTFPVYLRYTTTTMSGFNTDGTPYHDTGIPWVSYFNGGDALHGFLRSSYGYPQSLGCVEMTFNSAAVVWPRTPIGTLVVVQ